MLKMEKSSPFSQSLIYFCSEYHTVCTSFEELKWFPNAVNIVSVSEKLNSENMNI